MRSKHKYYDQKGNEITRDQAVDEHGTLRDGCSCRVPAHLRDGRPDRARYLIDSREDPLWFSRPGFRIADDNNSYERDAVDIAYREVEERNARAWMDGNLTDRQKRKQKYDPQGRNAGSEVTVEEDDPDEDINASGIERGTGDAEPDAGIAGFGSKGSVSKLGVPAEGSACTVRNPEYPLDQGSAGIIRNGVCVPIAPKSATNTKQERLVARCLEKLSQQSHDRCI